VRRWGGTRRLLDCGLHWVVVSTARVNQCRIELWEVSLVLSWSLVDLLESS